MLKIKKPVKNKEFNEGAIKILLNIYYLNIFNKGIFVFINIFIFLINMAIYDLY